MSARTLPVDQHERDLVVLEHDDNVLVEAGAGTGKTRTIVDRIVAMVAAGRLELRELAAITFTEAAASELRDRVRAGLEEAAEGRGPTAGDDDANERCHRALDQVDDAALTTIHGFAQRILTEHPLEAGLPLGFDVLDEIRARIDFEQRWAAFVDDVFADPALAPILLRGLAVGLSIDDLHRAARVLNDNHDRLPHSDPPRLDPPPLRVDVVLAALDHLVALRRDGCRDDDDLLARHIDAIAPLRDGLAGAARDDLDLLDALRELPPIRCSYGQARCWSDVKAARAACEKVDEVVHAMLGEQRRAVLEVLRVRVVEFVRDAVTARRRSGTLEFHDLLVLARDVLARDETVRRAASSRYRAVLVDEFQDTDLLQIEIAGLVASDGPPEVTGTATTLRLRPGALVLVGDPKQSIYRFRRADLRVYERARTDLDLEVRTLVESFRSVPGILTFVNHLFGSLLTDDPGVQAAHVELHPNRGSLGVGEPVAVFGEASDAYIAEVRGDEASDVAALVQRIKHEGWLVRDPVTERERPASFEDIALLIPSRTVLPALEDALERADVPVRVESQSLVFSTADVRDLLSALAAIDDPTDEIAVVAALRSPAFGCSDADLVEFARRGGRWDYRRTPPPGLAPDHPVIEGLAALEELWRERWWRGVSETLAAVVRRRQVLELAQGRARPRDTWRRVRYLLDQARAWDDAGDASLRDFVEWINQQADERARVTESVAPEPDHDAVRVLTVHGAKGLEFPIVVLAGLNTAPPNVDRPVVWTERGPELAVGTKNRKTRVETDGYADAARDEASHEAAERLRLLYVAMTRARDHLVLSVHRKASIPNCHAARIAEHLDGARFARLEIGATTPRPRRGRAEPAPTSADPAVRDEWLAHHEQAVRRAGLPASVAATALAHGAADDDPWRDKSEAGDEDPAPWRRGRAGTAIGRAVHAVLQTIDLATGAGLDATARAQALAEEVPQHESEIHALAASVLGTPVVRDAVAEGAQYWREVPVAASVDGVLVEGFVDLLVETADGLVIVDYKTDRAPSDTDLDAALRRYTPQGAAYALALEAVLGRPVVRCVFVFARSGAAVEREIADLPGAVAAVRDQVRALARPETAAAAGGAGAGR